MKNRVLLVCALLIFGLPAAAQAQLVKVTVETPPPPTAREGGEREKAADVFLSFDGIAPENSKITLNYSAPISTGLVLSAAGTAITNEIRVPVSIQTASNADPTSSVSHTNAMNDGNGTITLIVGSATIEDGGSVSVKDVYLDVSENSGPVTVEVKVAAPTGNESTLLVSGSNTITVISDIKLGVATALQTGPTVSTRGRAAVYTANLVVSEGFKGAFKFDDALTLEITGLPPEVVVDGTSTPSKNGDTSTGSGATGGVRGTFSVTGDEDGDPVTATLMLGVPEVADPVAERIDPAKEFLVKLSMTVNPRMLNTKVDYPLDVGDITARLTFSGSDFSKAYTPSTAIYKIRLDDCKLTFPVVTRLPDHGYDTAISIINPGGPGRTSGGLTFTFYGIDNPAVVYETTAMPTGVGLEADGTLAPGGTYQVLASQILAATDWGATFRGHVQVTAGYTNCQGVGWVTDFMGVNQAYLVTEEK